MQGHHTTSSKHWKASLALDSCPSKSIGVSEYRGVVRRCVSLKAKTSMSSRLLRASVVKLTK
eukprot:6353548-Amphidinium_carterae.1